MSETGFLFSFILIFVASMICKWLLVQLNIGNIRQFGQVVPDIVQGEINGDTLSRMSLYTVESSRFASLETLVSDMLILIVLLAGILPWLVARMAPWQLHPVLLGLIFFMVIALAGMFFGIPFDLYGTFVIEKKYGFSTITPKIWLSDFFKNLALSGILLALLLTPVLALISYAKTTWWILAWVFYALFQLLIMWLYPVLIAPLFNKYEPVKDELLKEKIMAMADKAGFKVKGILQVDAGKRSRHSNAYFTGIGKSRRIVLYDTLIASHSSDEILAVLAHEIGHWKKKHIRKQLIALAILSLGFFYLVYLFIDWPTLYGAFGFQHKYVFAGLLLISLVLLPIFFFFTPVISALSRHYEREADDFAYLLTGSAAPLAAALKRLAKDNLSNLYPHPLYAWFYYSHPPLIARIRALQKKDLQQN